MSFFFIKTFFIIFTCLSLSAVVSKTDSTSDLTSKGLKIVKEETGRINKISGNEGKRFAICIGVDDYEDKRIYKLQKARNDAKLLGEIFKKQGQFDYVYVMTDDKSNRDDYYPSKNKIEQTAQYVADFASPDDLIVFSFSGHGISNTSGDGYIVPVDALVDKDKIFSTSVKINEILAKFKEKGFKKTLLLIDACRETLETNKGINNNSLTSPIYTEADISAVFYGTSSGNYSYEDADSPNGIFTKFLAEALKGKADTNKDGIVTFSETETYVQEKVRDWAVNNKTYQKPYTKIFGEKFGDLALTIQPSEAEIEKQRIFLNNIKAEQTRNAMKISGAVSLSTGGLSLAAAGICFGLSYYYNTLYITTKKTYDSQTNLSELNNTYKMLNNYIDYNTNLFYSGIAVISTGAVLSVAGIILLAVQSQKTIFEIKKDDSKDKIKKINFGVNLSGETAGFSLVLKL